MAVFDFLDWFSVLRCLGVFVVSKQVSSDLRWLSHDFDQEWVFCKRKICFGIWSRKSLLNGFQLFVAFFDVFTRVSIFVLDRFDRLLASFEWLKVFWHDFWEQTVWKHTPFILWSRKSFKRGFRFFSQFFDIYIIFFAMWP